jgi:hypothetical protein
LFTRPQAVANRRFKIITKLALVSIYPNGAVIALFWCDFGFLPFFAPFSNIIPLEISWTHPNRA